MATNYFRMIDVDGDNLISFNEFLAPILESIPPRVSIAFVSDVRFKMECLNSLRVAFRTCFEISEIVTKELVKGKLAERQDPLSDHYVIALNELTFDTEELTMKQFMKEVARHEKHLLNSFVSQLYR